MSNCFLLLLGPSGVGKTSLAREICSRDARFAYVRPVTNRPLRPGEGDKIHATDAELDEMVGDGQILTVNEIYGNRYGTPRAAIEGPLSSGIFPVLDWPVTRAEVMREHYGKAVFAVYLKPTSIDELAERLQGRDGAERRLHEACEELSRLRRGEFAGQIDMELECAEGRLQTLADEVIVAAVAFGRTRA